MQKKNTVPMLITADLPYACLDFVLFGCNMVWNKNNAKEGHLSV